MTDVYSLAYAESQADTRVTGFKRLLLLVLAAEVLFALALLIFPTWTSGLAGIPSGVLPAIWGAFLLWTVVFQVPGLLNPVHSRLPVVIGVLGRYGMGIAYLCLSMWLCAIVTLAFGLALNLVYHRMVRSVIMSRP